MLNHQMQERLDKWRSKTLPVTSSEKVRGKTPVYVARKEYGDEFSEEAELQKRRNNGERSSR